MAVAAISRSAIRLRGLRPPRLPFSHYCGSWTLVAEREPVLDDG